MSSEIDHTDYRAFLRTWLAAQNGRPSLRTLATRASCSPSLLSNIMARKRDLAPARVAALTRAMGLSDDDARLFAALVDHEHAPTIAARRRAAAELAAMRRFRASRRRDDLILAVFSKWYLQAIVELARCPGFRADPQWIAEQLRPPISLEEATTGFDALIELGILIRDDEGRISVYPGDGFATTHDVPPSAMAAALRANHLWVLARAGEALTEFKRPERNYSTLSMSLSPAGLERLKGLVHQFQEDMIGLASTDDGPRDRVYTVAVQAFPLSATIPHSTDV